MRMFLRKDDSSISKVFFYSDHSFNNVKNALTASIEYVISTKLFDAPLYQNWHLCICLYAIYF